MADRAHSRDDEISPGDLVARTLDWLESNPDAPVADRAAAAMVVECGGDQRRPVAFAAIAERAGLSIEDVVAGLHAVADQQATKEGAWRA